MSPGLFLSPHKRLNPLTGEWVLVSPHRAKRPWQGQQEEVPADKMPAYDPGCYLCPGNRRAGGARNPDYRDLFVFDNDFAALLPDTSRAGEEDPLFIAQSERGICRVVCFSPRHDLTLASLGPEPLARVIETWRSQYEELSSIPWIRSVQIFENRGAMMGCSNPHPHGQIWANETVPVLPAREGEMQKDFLDRHGECLLCRYVREECRRGERVIFSSGSVVAAVPYWAVWPFELLVLPREHAGSLSGMSADACADLAAALGRIGRMYNRLFNCSFPYSMGIHQQPADGTDQPHWHLHLHYFPPLLRSATVRKFMVGYEMLATPQRDITPEEAAQKLREADRQ